MAAVGRQGGSLCGALQALRSELQRAGRITGLAHRPEKMPAFDVWGNAGDAVPLMKAVEAAARSEKNYADPGRFVGGI